MVVSLLSATDFLDGLVARWWRSGGEMTVFRYVLNNYWFVGSHCHCFT